MFGTYIFRLTTRNGGQHTTERWRCLMAIMCALRQSKWNNVFFIEEASESSRMLKM